MPARESWSRIRSDDQESTEVRSVRVAPLACLAYRRVQARALEGSGTGGILRMSTDVRVAKSTLRAMVSGRWMDACMKRRADLTSANRVYP